MESCLDQSPISFPSSVVFVLFLFSSLNLQYIWGTPEISFVSLELFAEICPIYELFCLGDVGV